jgi:hypothetical protein
MNYRRKKLGGVIIKLDFEKAYDKVKWSFLLQATRMKGFSPSLCAWIQFYSILQVGPFFCTFKGLRQGYPLSPILFNIVADMLAILFARAKEENQFQGIVPHLVLGVCLFFSMLMIQWFSCTTIFNMLGTSSYF